MKTSGIAAASFQPSSVGMRASYSPARRQIPPGRLRGDAENAVTDFPAAHRVSHGFHFTRELEPGNVLGVTGRRRIIPFPLHDVGPVQTSGADPHLDTVGSWRRGLFNFLHADPVDTAM
jgi:hypothetical protein